MTLTLTPTPLDGSSFMAFHASVNDAMTEAGVGRYRVLKLLEELAERGLHIVPGPVIPRPAPKSTETKQTAETPAEE